MARRKSGAGGNPSAISHKTADHDIPICHLRSSWRGGLVSGIRLPETERPLSSMLALTRLKLPAPGNTTLSTPARAWKSPARCNDKTRLPNGQPHILVDNTRLQNCGARGQWLNEMHGTYPVMSGAIRLWISMR